MWCIRGDKHGSTRSCVEGRMIETWSTQQLDHCDFSRRWLYTSVKTVWCPRRLYSHKHLLWVVSTSLRAAVPSLTCSSFHRGRNARKWLHIIHQHLYSRNEAGRKICPTAKNYSSQRWWAPKNRSQKITNWEGSCSREESTLQHQWYRNSASWMAALAEFDQMEIYHETHQIKVLFHLGKVEGYLATFPFPGCWCPSVCRHKLF